MLNWGWIFYIRNRFMYFNRSFVAIYLDQAHTVFTGGTYQGLVKNTSAIKPLVDFNQRMTRPVLYVKCYIYIVWNIINVTIGCISDIVRTHRDSRWLAHELVEHCFFYANRSSIFSSCVSGSRNVQLRTIERSDFFSSIFPLCFNSVENLSSSNLDRMKYLNAKPIYANVHHVIETYPRRHRAPHNCSHLLLVIRNWRSLRLHD